MLQAEEEHEVVEVEPQTVVEVQTDEVLLSLEDAVHDLLSLVEGNLEEVDDSD